VLLFVQLTICATFGASFIQKARSQSEFALALGSFGIPMRVRRECALLITALEILTASLVLIPGPVVLAGFTLAAILLVTFALVLAKAIRSDVHATCNCFGSSGLATSWFDVYRNIGLLALVTTGWATVVLPLMACIHLTDRSWPSLLQPTLRPWRLQPVR
jgi:hypothetical protein